MKRPGHQVALRDLLMLMLSGFVMLVVILVLHVKEADEGKPGDQPPGHVIVEAIWPAKLDIDVDLWVKAPGDIPVGYSNLNGRVFNLLRDDLGSTADALDANYENAYTRGAPLGTYVVNLHMYRNGPRVWPVPIEVAVSVRPPEAYTAGGETPSTIHLLKSRVELKFDGQEITVFRFSLDTGGKLVPGSVDSFFVPLRSAGG